MKAFIGIIIFMGIIKLPRLELYWSNQYNGIESPGIARVMPLVRFEQLFRCFHLSNNETQIPYGQPGHDKLFKVRSLLGIVVPHFQTECSIHRECTIDEAMIPYKGRLAFKQYMKDKPTKWGIKVFVLADAHNGYIKNIQIYSGKSMETSGVDIGLCSKVCLDLFENLETSGLQLYTDNYYTSPILYLHLYKTKEINACGTCRPNRQGFPKELVVKATKHNRGHYDYRSNGPLVACSWVDKRSIYFVSTLHIGELASGQKCEVKRRQQDGTSVDVACPPCLPDYQAYMRGVDRGDQLQSYYNVGRKSRKWWRRIFFYIIECCILNSYVLHGYSHEAAHKQKGRAKLDVLKFRLELGHQLIGTYSSRSLPGRPRSDSHTISLRLQKNHQHWPILMKKKE